jgi:hypothetical protein
MKSSKVQFFSARYVHIGESRRESKSGGKVEGTREREEKGSWGCRMSEGQAAVVVRHAKKKRSSFIFKDDQEKDFEWDAFSLGNRSDQRYTFTRQELESLVRF